MGDVPPCTARVTFLEGRCPIVFPVFSQLHCTVPAYNFPVTALAIAPNTNNLVIAHSDQQVSDSSAFQFPLLHSLEQLGGASPETVEDA